MIQFVRFPGSQLFTTDAGSPSGSGYMAYFLSIVPDEFPETITINQSWDTNIGFYVFLKSAPKETDMAKFAAEVTKYFAAAYPAPDYTGFAWLTFNDIAQTIKAEAVVTSLAQNDAVAIAADTSFYFANYSMPLKQQAPIVPVKDNEDNIVAFTYEYPPYEGAPLPRRPYNIQLPLAGNQRGSLLGQVSLGDLSNNAATGWNASLYYVINYNDQDIAQNYPLFETGTDKGLQILFDYVLNPVEPLNPDKSYLAFTGTSFFLQKNNEGQWYIELNGQNQLPSYFRTVYGKKVNLIPLTDSSHPPKLVFEELPPVDGNPRYYLTPAGDFELAVQDADKEEGVVSDNLICGLSGAESVQFISKSKSFRGNVLRFVAKQNAYAPVFPIIKTAMTAAPATPRSAALAGEAFNRHLNVFLTAKRAGLTSALQTSQAGLDSKYKTSWINIRPNQFTTVAERAEKKAFGLPNQTPVYYSQPNDAALYDHEGVKVDVTDELLALRNTPAAFFPEQVTQSLPMVPYAGVVSSAQFTYPDIQQFEKQIIVPVRREKVSSIPQDTQTGDVSLSAATKLTTTPQGLLATIPEFGLDWQSVLLAKSQSRGIEYSLEFTNGVTKELRDSLQSNQLFLVATEAAPLGTFLNKITIADWPFTINVGTGSDKGDFRNIIIFKFAGGSLENRVADTQSWSNASTFNQYPVLVSKWITSYIETTKLNAQTDTRYLNFLEIVQNPAWNGILVLKVDIGVENFPDDLKGLLAGIKRDEFYAHHFGMNVNFIEPVNGKLTLPKSSLFGLINYIDKDYRAQQDTRDHLNNSPFVSVQQAPSPVPTAQALYDFKVLTLQVVFENSEIKDFASKIQLVTTAWFDEPAQLNTTNMGSSLKNQTIEFNGSYEKHNGVNTYTFVTRPGQTYKFLLESQTLNYVEIVKAQFYTITDQEKDIPSMQAADLEKISSRFIFWGYMNFQLIESFDLFSFGDRANQKNTNNTGLYFSGLGVNMDFMLNNATGDATDRTFIFDPARMSFDMSQSTPRDNSLFRNFPINLAGLIYSKKDDESKPSDLGFLPVAIRSKVPINGQSLTEKWYALLYNLNLGSMGALAAKAGFVSQISTAWSPDTSVRRLTTGIKLPGVGGQKTLSLQSVLSINIQSFTFVAGEQGASLSYLLKFNNVKLSILGKKLPGAADTQFILFGDATGVDKTTLAWYAAYYAPKKPATLPPTGPLTIKI